MVIHGRFYEVIMPWWARSMVVPCLAVVNEYLYGYCSLYYRILALVDAFSESDMIPVRIWLSIMNDTFLGRQNYESVSSKHQFLLRIVTLSNVHLIIVPTNNIEWPFRLPVDISR